DPRVLEILEHLLADVAGEEVLVGPPRLQGAAFRETRLPDRRLEHLTVDGVEIHHPALAFVVGDLLLTERHDHETDLQEVGWHGVSLYIPAARPANGPRST